MSHRRRVPSPVLPITAAVVALLIALGGGLAIERYLADGRPVALAQSRAPSASAAPQSPDGTGSAPATTRPPRVHRRLTARPASPTATPSTAAAAPPSASRALNSAAQVVKLTNDQRAQHGCAPLRVDARLAKAARTHGAADCHTQGLLHHRMN